VAAAGRFLSGINMSWSYSSNHALCSSVE